MLKLGGIFICSTPNIRYTRHPKYHVHEFHPKEFWELLEKNFRRVEKYGQYISYFQRLNDIIMLKTRIFNFATKVLSMLPYGGTIKESIRKVLHNYATRQEVSLKPVKIHAIDVSIFNKHLINTK